MKHFLQMMMSSSSPIAYLKNTCSTRRKAAHDVIKVSGFPVVAEKLPPRESS